jgi:N-acyl-D-aspartate/D-glutamate deacylase
MTTSYDLVIRSGLVVDGTGATPVESDVAVSGGKIAALGKGLSGKGRDEIDACGQIVTPGFVDVHTHYDGQASWDNRLTPSSQHGVTTVVMGNCGVGFAPCRQDEHEDLIRLMDGVEDIPFPVLDVGLPWTWETFPEYLDALESLPHDIDLTAYVPHAALRVYVMGERAVRREASTEADRAHMARLLKEAVLAGAAGFGSSQTLVHRSSDGRPIPTMGANEAEYMALAMAMKDAGHGIIQYVGDWPEPEQNFAMLKRLMKASGRPLTFSLVQTHMAPELAMRILEWTGEAADLGFAIKAQVLPRPVGFLLSHALTLNPFYSTPTYGTLTELPFERRIAELRKADVRKKILSENIDPDPKIRLGLAVRMFDDMFLLGDPPDYEPPADTSIAAQARARGVTPEELAYDLLLEGNGTNILYLAAANYIGKSLDFVAQATRHKDTVVGLGDGGAHLGTLCDASYTTSMLLEWPKPRAGGVRMDLAQTVRALSRRPAEMMGFLDRGQIAPGLQADLNIIDLDRLTLNRPEIAVDLPAGGRRLIQKADGYVATFVNGEAIRREGRATDALPGRLVRGPRPAPAST